MVYPVQAKKSLGEQAYDLIREAIITLQFKPGQMVYESELGNQFGMSRTPIREGIRMLFVEDLIEVLPQRGMRVSLISESKVEDIRFVRESLEVSAFRRTANLWAPGDHKFRSVFNHVQQVIEDQRVAADEGDMLRFLYLDEAFHRTIMEQTGNQTLITVVSQMRGHLNRVRMLGLQETTSMSDLIDEHVQLFEAIQKGDEEQTVHLLTHHLQRLSLDLSSLKEKYGEYFQHA